MNLLDKVKVVLAETTRKSDVVGLYDGLIGEVSRIDADPHHPITVSFAERHRAPLSEMRFSRDELVLA